jgi:hypothetical protein
MVKCYLCSKDLKEQNLDKHFQITLGDFIKGEFKGDDILYIHTQCLDTSEFLKNPLFTPI